MQTAFAKGSRVLRKAGVLYPRTNWLFPAQHRLAFALKSRRIPGTQDTPDANVEVAELLAAIRRAKVDRVFLSSEEFFSCPPDAIAWLKTQLSVDQVDIITFLRRPDTFLVSCYNQKMRQPGNGFTAPIQRFVESPKQIAPEIDFRACVGAWADVFGDDQVALHTYEAGPPLVSTLKHLGLQPGLLPDDPTVNRSVPGAVVETMRYAKAISMPVDRQRRLFNLASDVFAEGEPFYLPDHERAEIIETFEEDNTDLFARFGLKNPYTKQAFTPVAHLQDYNLSHIDMLRLIDLLL